MALAWGEMSQAGSGQTLKRGPIVHKQNKRVEKGWARPHFVPPSVGGGSSLPYPILRLRHPFLAPGSAVGGTDIEPPGWTDGGEMAVE